MAFEVDINLGEAFAQIKGKGLDHTWYQPRRSLVDGLKDVLGAALGDGGKVRVTSTRISDLAETPSTAAAFVTAGFETLCKEFNPDTTFAVSARVRSDGSEMSGVDISELEALASKLALLKTTSVAVCLLHAKEFQTHEDQISKFLIERGFTVFVSHDEAGFEAVRFAAAVKKAARFAWLSETAAQLQTDLATLGSWTVAATTGLEVPKAGAILHLGFESFSFAESGVGPRRLRLQPSQRLVVGAMNAPTFELAPTAFGSGPMFLGRSFHPTLLDLFFAMDQLDEIELLKIAQGPRQKSRILEMLQTLAKDIDSEYRIEARSVAQDLQSLALDLITNECLSLAGGKAIIVTGGLAPALVPLLLKHRKGLEMKVSAEAAL